MVYHEEESQFASNNNHDWILSAAASTTIEQHQQPQQLEEEEEEDAAESDYSLDYEYLGPRKPNYRNEQDADSDASELSCCSSSSCQQQQDQQAEEEEFGFDMWDEDPYSTNDFTWESNDMRLTGFIKKRQKQLNKINSVAPWSNVSFWRKEKGWPRQLPSSSSTTNHDQSASALSLVLSDYGISEKLHTVYRDRIVECGKFNNYSTSSSATAVVVVAVASSSLAFNNINSTSSIPTAQIKNNETTYLENYAQPNNSTGINAAPSNNNNSSSGSSSSNIFNETHASISLPKTIEEQQQYLEQEKHHHLQQQQQQLKSLNNSKNLLSKFIPYTKYIKRSQFPVIFPQDAYLALGFEPLCLAEKYGYMAIGGVEGEFELYCCMDTSRPPIKIWGTKFKGKNNIIFMTNAVQIVRWSKKLSTEADDYSYFLIACMNDAGVLIYDLPSHHQCHSATATTANCDLHCHIKNFDHVPINDARVSPDGQHLVCVGDDACIFHLTVSYHQQKNRLVFGTPQKIKIPPSVLYPTTTTIPTTESSSQQPLTFSSQYVAWSKSSVFFAHTSDTHNYVLVWRTSPQFEMLYRIDAGGYTYAVQFHPEHEGVLCFSNRYGYLHTVNLDEAITITALNQKPMRVADFDKQQLSSDGHVCASTCQQQSEAAAIHHTRHLSARHEITMISFRGEKNRKLRILAKINGLQWSRDGCYLYVSTKKRVLAYEFLPSSCHIQSLEKMAGLKALSILEEQEEYEEEEEETAVVKKKRKRQDLSEEKKSKKKLWYKKWGNIPPHVRNNVLGDTHHLASHW